MQQLFDMHVAPHQPRLLRDQVRASEHTEFSFCGISGASTFLKHQKPSVKAVVVEPKEAPFLMEGKAGPHTIQGIAPGVPTQPPPSCMPVYDWP